MLLRPLAQQRVAICDREFYHDFVRRLFHQRRKLMRSVLVGMYRKQLPKQQIDAVLEELKFGPSARAEEQEVSRLVSLGNRFYDVIHLSDQERAIQGS